VDSTPTSRADELIALLDLRPHPEGGFYREVFRSTSRITTADTRGTRAALTTIFFLLPGGTHSRWHRVDSDEVWHFYEGDPLELLELDAAGRSLVRHRLGLVDGTGQLPVRTIPAGSWQAAQPLGTYTLVGCTVGPGFEFADFRMLADDRALADVVRRAWPMVASLV
jgi:predicted cupin superfamily sugar epimerase